MKLLVPVLILASLAAGCNGAAGPSPNAGGPGLAESMALMQYYTHKLALSVDAGNGPLANFYLHELEEISEETAANIPRYGGHDIGPLIEQMLLPFVEDLETAVRAGNWAEAVPGMRRLVDSCNACHAATNHAFILIRPATEINPYLQDFRPLE
jgi:hypothetical protein